MRPFEYYVVLSSLILGLGITQILTNVADIVSNLKNIRLGLAHSVFIFNAFLLHVQEWWYTYQYINDIKIWTLPLVLFLLLYPILLYLLARMLFPTGLRGHETNLEDYYLDQWKWLFAIFMAIVSISFLQNVIISKIPVAEQGLQIGLFAVLFLFILFDVKRKIAHNILLILQGIGGLLLIFFDPYQLQ